MSKAVIKFDQLDVNKIVFTKLEDNPRVKSQKIGYIRYKQDDESDEIQLKVQSPEIDAEAYGIPREGPYYPDPKSRAKYKFPFCHERRQYEVDYDSIEQFYNKLVEIDKFCNTDKFRNATFGEKTASQYSYQPIVRIPEATDEDEPVVDKNGQPYYRPPYTSIKLDLEYSADPEAATNKPTFALFENKDGKRTKIELNSFDDMLNYMKYRSKLRFIISFSKIYAMKTKSGTEKKKYGITLKASHVEVKRPAGASKVTYDEDAFIDSDTDDAITNVTIVTRNMGNLDVDEAEDEVEVDADDEEVQETLVSAAVTKAAAKQSQTKAPVQTQVQTQDDDEEDVVEEDVKPKAKAKVAVKPKAKTATGR
jgi:hypothetical protein